MRGFRLIGTGMAVPGIRFSNDDFSGWLDTSDAWIRPRTGIKARYFCRQPQEQVRCGKGTEDAEAQSGPVPESAYGPDCMATLAASAGEEALKNAGVSPSDIGLIICATSTPSEAMPSTACLVQKRLGIPSGTAALDLNAACTGFIYAMSVAFSLLQAGAASGRMYALVIGADAMSDILDFQDRSTCVLFGDGAGAAVMKLDEDNRYPCHFHLGAEGNDEALFCENGKLRMDGKAVFRFAVSKILGEMEQLNQKSGIKPDEITHIICHQANSRILDYVKRARHLRDEQLFMDLDRFGNTGAASVPIALADMKQQGRLKTGDSLFLVGFGGGLTWGSMYLKV
ncbi:MAG: ketoacyl-ACP synthase III [Lachnospiraceae bacterium]|nr:ketoacyl-ACP synthase III [Lachnospiraceae bacterium]